MLKIREATEFVNFTLQYVFKIYHSVILKRCYLIKMVISFSLDKHDKGLKHKLCHVCTTSNCNMKVKLYGIVISLKYVAGLEIKV